MRADTITLAVEEKYTPEELAEIAKNMAAAIADVETISTEKKTSDAAFNARLKKADEQVSALARQYNKGTEVAQIGCDIRYDVPEIGKKSYIRMDTGETVEVHDMGWEEKQESIQFPLTPAPEPAPDQVAAELDKMEAAGEIPPSGPSFRCPKCKGTTITLAEGERGYVCSACGFTTADEDNLLIDLPEPPPTPEPPVDEAGAA